MSGPRLDPDRLLEHREFVRGLALRLVADHHAADDVVSETWLAAMQNAPARPRSLRAWLARVTRNLAFRAARGEVRRRRREMRAARPERVAGTAEVVARLALEREVVDALLALDEPYRTTLLLRYYEDLAPREIATRTGANSATVRTRLKRGLDMLRARLDGALGDRRTWMLALVALVVPSKTAAASVAATTTGGIVAMSVKTKTTLAAALLLAALGGVAFLATRSNRERAAPRAVAGKDSVALAETGESKSTGVIEERVVRGPAVSVPVRVEDFLGQAIPGASVDCVAAVHAETNLGWHPWHYLFQAAAPEEVLAREVTGSDGIAHFSRPIRSSCLFVARKQGFARGSSSKLALYGPDDGRAITVRLGRAYSLSGRVLDDDRRPVSGALVIAASARTGWQIEWLEVPGRTRSDADGRYRFDDLPAREVALWAARGDGVPSRICTLDFPRIATFDFVLPEGGMVRGRVTNAETGAPVPDAFVRVQGYVQHRGVARTDADGRYEVALPPTELGIVTVDCPGYYQVHSQAAPEGGMLQGLGAWLSRGSSYTHDLSMRPAPKLFGRVTGPDGVLAGATIQAVSERGPMGLEYVRSVTDREGRYQLAVAPGRHRLEIGSRKLQFVGHRWINKNADASGKEPWIVDMPQTGAVERDIELVFNPLVVGTGRIEGRVVGPDGNPVAGARVWQFRDSVLTDAEGRFSLAGLPRGPKSVVADKPGFSASKPVRVELDANGAAFGVVVRLGRERIVEGVVRGVGLDRPFVLVASWPSGREQWDQSMKSSAWSRLWLEAQRIPVAADGTFLVRPIVAGRTYVRAGALNAALSPVEEIRAQTGQVEIELRAGRTLRGRVIDQRTRAPVARARVRLKSLGEKSPYPYYSGFTDGDNTVVAVTDGEGRFSVPHLDGEFLVKVSRDGYLDKQEPARDEATIELLPDLGLAGVVRFSDGAPAAGLKVRVHDLDGKRAGVVPNTGSDGRFHARRIGPGRYRLTIGGLSARTITTGLVEAGAKDLRITVERARDGEGEQWPEPVQGGGEIRGRIVDLSGKPLAGYRIWARHEKKQKESRLGRRVKSGSKGHFVLAGLANGTYHLRASAPGGLLFAERRGVALGTSGTKLVFDAIEGVVRDRAGGFAGGRRLRATRLAGEGGVRETVIGVDGRFRIDGLTPGEYRLSIEDRRRNYRLLPKARWAAGTRGARLTASLGARITIRVVGERGEAVRASAVAKRAGRPTLYAKSDEQGEVELTGLLEGEMVELTVRTRGFLPHHFGRVKAGARGLKAILRRGLRVTGRVLDPKAVPIADASIRLLHNNEEFSAHSRTNAAGGFDIGGLIDGRYSVEVYRMEEGRGAWKSCGTVEARGREITLTLRR